MQGRGATWSSVGDPTPLLRAPNWEATERLPFLSINGRRGILRPAGLAAQKMILNSGPLPTSHSFTTLLISAALLFLVRFFLSNSPHAVSHP